MVRLPGFLRGIRAPGSIAMMGRTGSTGLEPGRDGASDMELEAENLLESGRIENLLEEPGPPAENLLESERIEDVLEEPGPSPVVVVQYRSKALPLLLVLGSIILLGLGAAFVYHFREVSWLRTQAQLAERDRLRAIELARAEENELRLKALPTPADPVPTAVTTVAQASGPAASPTAPAPDSPTTGAEAGKPAAAPPHAGIRPPRVLAKLLNKPGPAAPAPTPHPPAAAGPADDPARAGSNDPAGPGTTFATVGGAQEPSPFDELNNGGESGGAPARVDVATAPASATGGARPKEVAPPPGEATPPVAAPAEPPLPSREETERQIRAEAARIKQEKDVLLEQQKEELHGLRDDERRQFLDELRMLIKVHGPAAGPEIEHLSGKAGKTDDPDILGQARRVITEMRGTRQDKVRKLRELGVPETVILNYVANELERNRGARNGPRTRNEVWIRAGKLLINYYDLDSNRSAQAGQPPAGQGQAAAPARPR